MLAPLRSIATALFRRDRFEQVMDDELQFHVDSHAAELERRGSSTGSCQPQQDLLRPIRTMTLAYSHGLRSPFGLSLAFLLIVWASTLANVQQPMATPPAPGSMVDVGGRRLHLNCAGAGSPTVVIESGGGAFSVDWELVRTAISSVTRVCTYDRAGYAWSDPGPVRDLPDQVASDFALLLEAGGVPPPYVLVGQSIGGIMVRDYQRRRPEQVVGMVLVDPTHDEGLAYMIDGKPKPISLTTRHELQQFMKPLMDRPAPTRVIPEKVSRPYDRLPIDLQTVRLWAEQRYALDTDRSQTPFIGEGQRQQFTALRLQRLERPNPLRDLPLVVITNGVNKQKAQLQALSTSGQLVIAENSCHEVHVCSPNLVIDGIRSVVDAIRNSR